MCIQCHPSEADGACPPPQLSEVDCFVAFKTDFQEVYMSIQQVVIKVKNTSSQFVRVAALIGILAAVSIPFLMLTVGGREANNLPWYVWMIVPLFLFIVLAAGFLKFRRESHEAEDISIRPKPR
jgi:hypothetical protein